MRITIKKTSLKWIIPIVVVIVIVLAAVFFVNRHIEETETVEVRLGEIAEAVYGLGTVTARQSFQLKLGINSIVKEFFVEEGQAVSPGQPLVQLKEGPLFKAPFSGVVTSVPFKAGELVYPQTPIVTVMNLKDRTIVVGLEQEGALRIRSGQSARMSFETLRGNVYRGKVSSLYPGDGQFLVRIEIPELPNEVIPGMTGDVAIEISKKNRATLVPLNAIQSGFVYKRNGRSFKKVKVSIGAVDGRWAELLEGDLKPGDQIRLLQKGR